MKTDWRCHMLAWLLAASTVPAADAPTGPYPSGRCRSSRIRPPAAPDGLAVVADRLTQAWGQQVLVVNRRAAAAALRPRGGGSRAGWIRALPAGAVDLVSLHPAAPNVPCTCRGTFCRSRSYRRTRCSSRSLRLRHLDPAGADRARQKRQAKSYATTGLGRLTHLTGELLQHQAGIKLLLVPYTGGPAHAFSDVTTGRVAMIIEGYSGIAGAARSGSVKLIAVASAKRLVEFPDVATVAETIPGFQATGWAVLVAPVGTPEAIIGKVSEDVREVVVQPELEKKLATLGSYTRPMSAAEATTFIHKQQQLWQPVLDEIAKKQK